MKKEDCIAILDRARCYFKEPSAHYAYLGIINNLEKNALYYPNVDEEFQKIHDKFVHYIREQPQELKVKPKVL